MLYPWAELRRFCHQCVDNALHCGLCAAELRDSRHRAAQTPPLSPACGSCRVFALAALYLDTALPSLLAGKEPFAGIVELFYQLEDAYKQAGLDISSLQLSTEVLPEVFYGVLIALAEGVGFLTVVLAKWFSTKAKADVRPMAPLSAGSCLQACASECR